jgi:AP endonuclease 1
MHSKIGKMLGASESKSRKRTSRTEISPPPKRQKSTPDKKAPLSTKRNDTLVKKAGDKKVVKAVKTEGVNVETLKVEEHTKDSIVEETVSVTKVKVQRKRKTKEEKEAEAMPLAERTIGSKILAGAHVSAAGGIVSRMYRLNIKLIVTRGSECY